MANRPGDRSHRGDLADQLRTGTRARAGNARGPGFRGDHPPIHRGRAPRVNARLSRRMNGTFAPLAIAQAVARNIVPLLGIVAFHWQTGNVLILYLLDTLLAMTVIIAGLASSLDPRPVADGIGGKIKTQAG